MADSELATPPASTEKDRALVAMFDRLLADELDPEKLFGMTVGLAVRATRAERGFLACLDPEGRVACEASRNYDQEEVAQPALKVSSSLVRQVLATGRSLCAGQAVSDPRLGHFPSVAGMDLRSVLLVPVTEGGKALAVLYLDNRFSEGHFGPREEALTSELGRRLGPAFARGLEQRATADRKRTLARAYREAARDLGLRDAFASIVGQSPAMVEVFRVLEKAVASDLPVLVTGESGTGKELVAQAIHAGGPRRERPFVAESCAALPEDLLEAELFGYAKGAFTGAERDRTGLFEAAHGGTLFLDEIGEASPGVQRKLLRAVAEGEVRPLGSTESRTVNVRLIAATNRDLQGEGKSGRFLPDLYFRIAVMRVHLPALRERIEDIPLLAESFLDGSGKALSAAALRLLLGHAWPGNVRELKNVLERARLLADDAALGPEHIQLDADIAAGPAAPAAATWRSQDVPASIRGRKAKFLRELAPGQYLTSAEYAARFKVTKRTANRDLKEMVDLGLLEELGRGRSTRFRRK